MSSTKSVNKKPLPDSERVYKQLIKLGILFIVSGMALFILIFYPVIIQELKYLLLKPNANILVSTNPTAKDSLIPIDKDFSIVVPKIGANARVIAQVDPYNGNVYQRQLTRGVAHAKGTSLPTESGNMFLFAHSSDNFYNANRYNSVFYLLNKLEKNDEVYIFYKEKEYRYKVTDTKIVNASAIQYLKRTSGKNQLTLMTCWPAGTTLKRLIIIGKLATEN